MHTWLAAAQARGETQRLQLAAASQAADAGKDASGRGEGAMACDDEFDSCAVLAAMDDTSGSPAEPGQTRQPPPPPVESQSSCSLQAVAATAAAQNPRAPSPCRLPACKNFCVCQVLGAASQGKGAGAKSAAKPGLGLGQRAEGGARGRGAGKGGRGRGGGGRGGWKGGKAGGPGPDGDGVPEEAEAGGVGAVVGAGEVRMTDALKGWTGKTPKKMLEEFLQKNKLPKARYSAASKQAVECTVSIGDDKYASPAGVECASVTEAEHLAAVYALFKVA